MSATPTHAASPEQRTAADPDVNTWVSASAGAGKTRVLVDRLLRLLLEGTPVNRVLCVTFTKAAAAEMAGRLFGQLADWAVLDDKELDTRLTALTGAKPTQEALGNARRLFAHVLDAPGGLKIQTIHSLCESLLARFPLEARVPTHFQVLDERTAMELLIAARDKVLESARAQEGTPLAEAVTMLSEISGEYAFADVMLALTNTRAKIRKMFETHGGLEGVVAATRERLGVGENETPDTVIQAACADGSFDELGLHRVGRAMLGGSVTDQKRAATLTAWLAAPDRRAALFDEYVGVYLTEKGAPRKSQATKKTLVMEPDAATVLGTEADRLMAVAAHLKAVDAARRAEGAAGHRRRPAAHLRRGKDAARAARLRGLDRRDPAPVAPPRCRAVGAFQARRRCRSHSPRRGPGYEPRSVGHRGRASRRVLRWQRRPRGPAHGLCRRR